MFFLSKKDKVLFKQILSKKPVIHFITNYVTANACANITLAVGGSPIMADEPKEVEEIASISNALVLNIGTINERTLKSMLVAGTKANKLNIPVILDPCGVGATTFRNEAIKTILSKVKISVLKGNYGEIATIYKLMKIEKNNKTKKNKSKGVDNNFNGEFLDIIKQSKLLSTHLNCIVCATGKIDITTDGKNALQCKYGNKIMSRITGCGCMLNGIVACCCAIDKNYLNATHNACCLFGGNYKRFLASYLKTAK